MSDNAANIPIAARNMEFSRRFVVVYHGATGAEDLASAQVTLAGWHAQGLLEYGIVANEMGEFGQGSTPHQHMYLVFRDRARTAGRIQLIQNAFPGAHVETAYADDARNIRYAKKEIGPNSAWMDIGIEPNDAVRRPAMTAERAAYKSEYDYAIALARSGRLNEIPASLLIRHHRALTQIAATIEPDRRPLDHQAGIWLWGPKGTWKTSSIHAALPADQLYIKSQDLWWDGYEGQPFVLIDDISVAFTRRHADDLKAWTGHTAFKAAIKGGDLGVIRPVCFFFTANFAIQEAFPNTLEARTRYVEPLAGKRIVEVFVGAPGELTANNVVELLHSLPPVVAAAPATVPLPDFIQQRLNSAPYPRSIPSVQHPEGPSITAVQPDHLNTSNTVGDLVLDNHEEAEIARDEALLVRRKLRYEEQQRAKAAAAAVVAENAARVQRMEVMRLQRVEMGDGERVARRALRQHESKAWTRMMVMHMRVVGGPPAAAQDDDEDDRTQSRRPQPKLAQHRGVVVHPVTRVRRSRSMQGSLGADAYVGDTERQVPMPHPGGQ